MTRYRYIALDSAGRRQHGVMEAAALPDVDLQLKQRGLDLVDARASATPFWKRRHPARTDLMMLFMNLSQLCRAGVPLVDALADLRDTAEQPALQNSLAKLVDAIKTGSPLSNAMAQQAGTFEPLLISMVHTGEESGQLAEVLAHISALLNWRETLAQQLKTAMLYPAMLALTIAAVVVFMMTYLVPQLSSFLLASGQTLPLQTLLLIGFSDICTRYWLHALLFTGLIFLSFHIALARLPGFRDRLDRFKLECWIFGPLLQKIILARFASTFAMMYRAGLSVLDCLNHLQPLLGNRVLSNALAQIRRDTEGGRSLTGSFRDSGLFPALVTRMLHVGETTGGLDEALLNVSELYNRDIQAAIRRMQLMIEPAMTLLLGILLGWIMLAVLAPIYDLVSGGLLR